MHPGYFPVHILSWYYLNIPVSIHATDSIIDANDGISRNGTFEMFKESLNKHLKRTPLPPQGGNSGSLNKEFLKEGLINPEFVIPAKAGIQKLYDSPISQKP